MKRPSMDETLMDMAKLMARRATCSRIQVGCVIANDGRVLSSGFNGAPAKMPHCDHDCDCGGDVYSPGDHDEDCVSQRPCTISVHAEANAVAFAAKNGIALLGSQLFTTLSPCVKCAHLIINSGVWTVSYDVEYRDTTGIEVLLMGGVRTYHNGQQVQS